MSHSYVSICHGITIRYIFHGGISIAMLVFVWVCCNVCLIMQPQLEVGMKYCIVLPEVALNYT